MAGPGQVLGAGLGALMAARGLLLPWAAVLAGTGVGLWFAWPSEPGLALYALVLALLAAGLALRALGPDAGHAPAMGLVCLCAGFLAAGARGHLQAAPMLDFRYHGPVEGRIVAIDRSQSDALRLTLDRVVLERVAPDRTPARVRVSVQEDAGLPRPAPGQVVMMTAHLSAPEGPVEPGGFDFRRMAFFERLGAVGYTRTPVLLVAPPDDGALRIDRLRDHLSGAIRAAIPGDPGAFAAGVLTGDRSGLSLEATQALRDSNLAHLLAISGMNLAFLVAFVFALIRYGVALVPPLALRIHAKKVAAAVSLGVAFFYLLLSGANVATERAFVMVAVMLGAILLDRRALTLRSVAIAALILLVWKPESLLSPGFQMSFAATIALIVGFGAVDRAVLRRRLPWWVVPVYAVVLSSLLGGFATAPYAAAHFNRFADYGLLANLLTVPVMGAVVMPAGALAAILAPLGLAAPALWALEAGSAWILGVARWIAGWEGAVTAIVAPAPWVLPVLTLGALWVVLGRGRLRWGGAVPVVLALAMWGAGGRPDAIISADGMLVGVMGPGGRVLSDARGGGFAARNWLENDGDLSDQATAAARPGFDGPRTARTFRLGNLRAVVLKGRGAAQGLASACATADLVILAAVAEGVPQGCRVIDQRILRQSGALVIRAAPEGLRVQAVRDRARLWSPEGPPPAVLAALVRPPALTLAADQ